MTSIGDSLWGGTDMLSYLNLCCADVNLNSVNQLSL
jgi:hypothetical protein